MKYLVTLECHTISRREVEANSELEAKQIAIGTSRGECHGDSMSVYEIEEML